MASGGVKYFLQRVASKSPLHIKFGGPKCKGKESSKIPPRGRPVASGGVKYPLQRVASKLPPLTKLGGPKCKGKETRAKIVC